MGARMTAAALTPAQARRYIRYAAVQTLICVLGVLGTLPRVQAWVARHRNAPA